MVFERTEEKRKEQRYAYPKTIEYTTGLDNGDVFHRGVVVNISKSGICLYVYAAHTEGQLITIRSSLPVDPRTAVVKWVKKISEGFYQSGMEFVLN